MKRMNLRSAVAAIEKHGILLVYPMDNRKEPSSLWSVFFPRSPMRWEWDEDGDDRVSRLWHLRSELSSSGKVAYAKWYRGRATLLSFEVFAALLAWFGTGRSNRQELSREAREILGVLDMDSPLSTKQIKLATDLRGRALESTYERAMKELWSRLHVVGYGEVDDGAFPSLAIGSSRILFEEQWNASLELDPGEAWEILERRLGAESLFLRNAAKLRKESSGIRTVPKRQPKRQTQTATENRKCIKEAY